MIILDTNVISELMARAPDPAVLQWSRGHALSALHTTAVTKAEIFYGLEVMPKGKRREATVAAAVAMFDEDFAGRVLPLTEEVAAVFATLVAERRRLGRPILPMDALIAAIARHHGAAVATRDTGGFDGCGLDLINPWETP